MTSSKATELKDRIGREKVHIKKILVPLDGSNCSIRAAKYAIEAAKLQKAQIFFVHVISRIAYGFNVPGSFVDQYLEEAKNQAQSWVNKIIEIAKKEGVYDDSDRVNNIKTDIIADVNSVTEAIVDYSSQKNFDLIVIGTRGRTGLKRFLLGSVAHGVVQHAHCAVLLVR